MKRVEPQAHSAAQIKPEQISTVEHRTTTMPLKRNLNRIPIPTPCLAAPQLERTHHPAPKPPALYPTEPATSAHDVESKSSKRRRTQQRLSNQVLSTAQPKKINGTKIPTTVSTKDSRERSFKILCKRNIS